MSGSTYDRKIAKGLAKAGKKLGYTFNVYRPDNYITPMGDENFIKTEQVSWSEDKSFEKNPEDKLTHFAIYANYKTLEVGDILNSPDINRTFVITEINELRGVVAIQTPDVFDVLRPIYTPSADKKIGLETVSSSVPCVVEYKSAASDQSVLPAGSSSTGSRSQIELWTWMPISSLKLNDTLDINGDKFNITSLKHDHKGTVINARSAKIGT